MSLEISRRELEGIVILDLQGRLVAGAETSELRDAVRELADAGRQNAVLNLQEIGFIDSTGLGALVICFTTLRKAGGALKLLNLSRKNIELLVLTKLTTVFELFTDEQDAVNSFFPGRQKKEFDILSFVQQNSSDK
jgi:anti-sigma B factor antagonist